jgi:hypothetical protein
VWADHFDFLIDLQLLDTILKFLAFLFELGDVGEEGLEVVSVEGAPRALKGLESPVNLF